MSTLDDIKRVKAEINELRERVKKQVSDIFSGAVMELFVKYPNLTRISWTQYTPYFNDGDTCEFGSNHTSPAIYFSTTVVEDPDEEYDRYEEEWSEYDYYDYAAGYKNKTLKIDLTSDQLAELETAKGVIEFLKNFDEDDMYNLFGDHQKVVITRNGIDVEEYEHD